MWRRGRTGFAHCGGTERARRPAPCRELLRLVSAAATLGSWRLLLLLRPATLGALWRLRRVAPHGLQRLFLYLRPTALGGWLLLLLRPMVLSGCLLLRLWPAALSRWLQLIGSPGLRFPLLLTLLKTDGNPTRPIR